MRLVVESGPEAGRSFACQPGLHLVGKLESCDIRLSDPHVSRRHGELEVTLQGCLYRDLGSTNGTLLQRGDQRTRLDGGQPEQELRDGDLLVVGETRLRVEAGERPKAGSRLPSETVISSRPLAQLADTRLRSLDDLGRLRAIYQLEQKIHLEYDPERMLAAIVDAIPEALPQATHVVVVLLDREGESFARTLGKVRGDARPSENRVPISTSIAKRVLEERKSLLWRDVPQDFRESESVRAAGISSSICAPLWTGEKIVGFLQVDNRSGAGAFQESDLDLLTIFANSAALALVNRELHAQEEAYARLRETERVKSQYMRKVSHELRSPLGAIQSTLKVVLDGLTGEIAAKAKEMVARAEARARGLLKVTNDLLSLSRAREAKVPEQLAPVNLRDVVAKVAGLHDSTAAEKGVSLEVEVEEDLPSLKADPEAMEQLLTNLVANGIKYTPGGGKVRLSVTGRDGSIRIVVSDTGIGIPFEDLDKVFAEFYRSENARKLDIEGTGLGMSIVKAIVEACHGDVSVESELGVGSTFEVVLPVSSPSASDGPSR